MERFDKSEIENFFAELQCPKDFRCCESDFKNICRAKDIGLERSIICMEEITQDADVCAFSVPFGGEHFCNCSMRIYIAKKFKK